MGFPYNLNAVFEENKILYLFQELNGTTLSHVAGVKNIVLESSSVLQSFTSVFPSLLCHKRAIGIVSDCTCLWGVGGNYSDTGENFHEIVPCGKDLAIAT